MMLPLLLLAAQAAPQATPKSGPPDPAEVRFDRCVDLAANDAVAAESEAARVSALKEILDRGYGKATQPLGQDPDLAPLINIGTGVPRAG